MAVLINDRSIGEENAPYIVAEISGNHGGNIDNAFELIRMAKDAGANAAKLQTYKPGTMTLDCDKSDFEIRSGLWKGYSLFQLYESAYTPWEWHKDLFDYAASIGITCFSSPFDETAVDLLEKLDAPAYKIASFELTDLPLIEYAASTNKPLIISTGMGDIFEIDAAVETVRQISNCPIILLHCVSAYPSRVGSNNLRLIEILASRYSCPVGLSDHSRGNTAALGAVVLGATLIEKHIKLPGEIDGPDATFSIDQSELETLCTETAELWKALKNPPCVRPLEESQNKKFRRSIYVSSTIRSGEVLTVDNVKRLRPGYGLNPKWYKDILGKRALCDLTVGTALEFHHIDLDEKK